MLDELQCVLLHSNLLLELLVIHLLLHRDEYTNKVDIWAVGIIYYEMIYVL